MLASIAERKRIRSRPSSGAQNLFAALAFEHSEGAIQDRNRVPSDFPLDVGLGRHFGGTSDPLSCFAIKDQAQGRMYPSHSL
jgi:hypothetical protein